MHGKLGHGAEIGRAAPCVVEDLVGHRVVQVACGSRHTVALCVDPEGLTKSTTEVYTWGDKGNGVCGHGDTHGHQYKPRLISSLQGQSVKQICACGFHSACVTDDGSVFTWGDGKFGRLGHGNEENQNIPKRVLTLSYPSLRVQHHPATATAAAANEGGGTAGAPAASASSSAPAAAAEELVPRYSGLRCKVKQVKCGGFHTAAITEAGQILTWGGGEHGQLGHGNHDNQVSPCLVAVLKDVTIRQISCGWSHTVALADSGSLFTWGNGDHGKLGHGDACKLSIPRLVKFFEGKDIYSVSSYNEHTAALVRQRPCATMSTLAKELGIMVNNPLFSDVTFIVEGKPIHAHRAILSARSEHFANMFKSGLKESHEKEVAIPVIRHHIFLALLGYLYTDTISSNPEEVIELFEAADLYVMERLKVLCENKLSRFLTVENSAHLFATAARCNSAALRKMCLAYIVQHFDVASKSKGFLQLSRELILEVITSRTA